MGPWNPSELPIPDPAQLKISVRGGNTMDRAALTRDLEQLLEEKQEFPRQWTEPDVSRSESILILPASGAVAQARGPGREVPAL